MSDPFLITVIRHGHTSMNATVGESRDMIRGWKDVPLSLEGIQDAENASKALQGAQFDIIYASDLSRALDTAEIIAQAQGTEVRKVRWLRPWDLGNFTGMVSSKAFPMMLEFIKNEPDQKVPGGESFNTFKKRFLDGLIAALTGNPGKKLAFVTHHRNERVLDAWVKNNCDKDYEIDVDTFIQYGIDPGKWEEISIQLHA